MRINDETINKVTLNNVCRQCAGVHCKTEVEAYKLLSYFDKFGIKWADGKRAIDTLNHNIYGSNTCYRFNGLNLFYCSFEYLVKSDHVVYDFDTVLLDEKKPRSNKRNLFKILGIKPFEYFKLTGKPKQITYFMDIVNTDFIVFAYDDKEKHLVSLNPAFDIQADYYDHRLEVEQSNQLIIDIITDKYSIIKIPQEEQK